MNETSRLAFWNRIETNTMHRMERKKGTSKKALAEGLRSGLWEIRTLDLFRVKEAL